jgi:ABC-2 type transport system ATP-binding protein
VIACDRTESLVRRLDEKRLAVQLDRPPAVLPAMLTQAGATLDADGRLIWRYRPSLEHVGTMLDRIRAAGLGIVDLDTASADLEEVFLRLTARDETIEPAVLTDP